jgi:hypothetical protein
MPLATPASVVTARLVNALGPSRSSTRSAASNSWWCMSWAEFARQHGFEVEGAKFEEWDAGDRTFDAIVAGMT